jgi:hypothetical protein
MRGHLRAQFQPFRVFFTKFVSSARSFYVDLHVPTFLQSVTDLCHQLFVVGSSA